MQRTLRLTLLDVIVAGGSVTLGACSPACGVGLFWFCVRVARYRKAAEQGHANAQCDLALMYEFGNGMKRDYPLAVKW